VHLIVGLAYAQYDVDKQRAATDSEEETNNMTVENLKPSEEN
jgi:hypothetical protein